MGRVVLLADPVAERAQSFAELCRGAGLECQVVSHGAAALESALQTTPSLVITPLDLPLVDGLKLAEILRANPRTRAARFLFLAPGKGGEERSGVGDTIVRSDSQPREILHAAIELIVKQEHIASVEARTEEGGSVEGQLEKTPLSDLLQLFQLNRMTGRLELEAPGGTVALLRLQEGEVVRAETGRVVNEKALLRTLCWSEGRFHFEPSTDVVTPAILTPTRALLREGARQLEETRRLASQLPTLSHWVRLRVRRSELPTSIHPLTHEVLELVESHPRVAELLDHCRFPDYQVLRTLHTLAQRELVELVEGRSGFSAMADAALSGHSEGLINPAQEGRIRRSLAASAKPGPGGGALLPDAKIVVVPGDPAATPDFVHMLSRAPGVALEPAVAQGRFGTDYLGPLARIEGEEIGIDLLQIPVEERFAPLWPLAGYGALGALVLLGSSIREASARVNALAGRLGHLPRTRTFYVVLLRKGERISPDEVRENLALIDEASLFLLPMESGRHPAVLLRSLFARVLA